MREVGTADVLQSSSVHFPFLLNSAISPPWNTTLYSFLSFVTLAGTLSAKCCFRIACAYVGNWLKVITRLLSASIGIHIVSIKANIITILFLVNGDSYVNNLVPFF